MKARLMGACAISLVGYLAWQPQLTSQVSTLSVFIGQEFEEVIKASSYPVRESSNLPTDDPDGFGVTWVTTPAVTIRFNDSQYGFTLPPTTFAAIAYMNGRVMTIRTSASLKKMPFDDAASVLENLQTQFKLGGWQPQHDTEWFDLSTRGREDLHQSLRRIERGHLGTVSLRAPEKYSMYFTIRCDDNCESQIGKDRYLVDISVGEDYSSELRQRKLSKPEKSSD